MNQRKSYSLHQVYTLIIILMSLWYGALKGWGQSGRLFTSDSQLSSSLVNQVYQDRKGFIYIATRNGLDQYDGNEFQKFQKTGLPGAISSMHVNCVSEDSTGRLLVGLDKGLQAYDYATGRFQTIPLLNDNDTLSGGYVSSILCLKSGEVWISTSGYGLFRMQSGDKSAQHLALFEGDGSVERMTYTPDGAVWLSSINYGIYRWKDGKVQRFLGDQASSMGLCCLASDHNGILFAGSPSKGLFAFDAPSATFK